MCQVLAISGCLLIFVLQGVLKRIIFYGWFNKLLVYNETRGCKQSKVNGSLLFVQKINVAMNFFNIVLKLFFFSKIISMMIIFHFIFKMLKNPILKVELSRISKNISTCTKCPVLQNGLHVDEILI